MDIGKASNMVLGYALVAFLAAVSLMTGMAEPMMLALLGAFLLILIEWAKK
jgi:hypothetical protein